ncbi:MAG: hypothetical protein IH623_03870 [Verrucomicrobia bacterium]|nr:hypothetical protein [Verrucomicrobiota bacterium]
MKLSHSLILPGLLLAGFLAPAHAQWTEQSFQLNPGWNAIFLEVHPDPADCDTLFSGLPVESVWDFNPSVDSPQFVQDPATLIPGAPNWLTWFPPASPLANQGNLFILRDGRPYLIKLANDATPTTWTVKGKPSLRKTTWRPGAVNFVGFRVGPTGPTFQALFAGETGLTGQPVYALNTGGVWQQVGSPSTTRPESGKAYWVRCIAPAQRTATVEVDPGSRQGLRFSGGTAESALRIRNTSTTARNLSLRLLPSLTPPAGQPPLAGPFSMEYWKTDYTNSVLGWEPLPAMLGFSALPSGAEWNVRLGVRRASLGTTTAGSQFQGLIEVTDDLGTRWLVPVSVDTTGGTVASGAGPVTSNIDFPQAGLWVGESIINAVSQPAHAGNPTLPRPAGGELSFRLIVHVDATGTARLLQRVFLVRKPPTYLPDPENPGFNILNQPSRTVVLTDEALIPSLIGPGEILGRRISSAAFGFSQPLGLTNGPFGTGTLNGVITLGYNDPLNPFKHVYHPDHDNLNERFEQPPLAEGNESFTVTRNVALEFTATDPLGLNPPGWGDEELGGLYRETIAGLHRSAIQISGTFRLVRVARVSTLNN